MCENRPIECDQILDEQHKFRLNLLFRDLSISGTTSAKRENMEEGPSDSSVTSSSLTSQTDWREDISKNQRNYIIGRIVKSIIPEPDSEAVKDKRVRSLINYARLVEKEKFEMSMDREEYYHSIAEKIFFIRKEIQQRRKSRAKASS